jgi:uncharacterized protein (TIGR02231 family)
MIKKNLIFICVCLIFTSASPLFATEEKITLFTNQALIEKELNTSVDKGVNKIDIEIEAFSIDRDSISAKVFGAGQIYSVQLKTIYLKEEPQENIQKLQNNLENLENEKKILTDQIGVTKKKEKFLNSLIDFSQTEIPKELKTNFPSPEDLRQTLDFLDNSLHAINQKENNISNQIKELNKKIILIKQKLNSLRNYRQKSKNVIEVVFDSEKKQNIKIIANYICLGAGWSPLYKVNVPLELDDVNLTMFSKITQKTGEDWQNVNLTLSNVIPLKGINLPNPKSWILMLQKQRQPNRLRHFSQKSVMQDRVRAGEASLPEEKKELAKFAEARTKKLPLSFEYQLPQKLTIESKEKETLLPVFSKTLDGEFYYWAAPRINQLCYLVSEIKPDSQLLAGNLNVYFAGRFIGKTYLSQKKAGEKLLLNLGATRDIKIKREKITDKKDETFFGKIKRNTIVRKLSFKITIENLKDKIIKIKILDSIPVSNTDKIAVKDVGITPEPIEKNYQDKEGLHLWELSLKPKEKKEIKINFTVTYPDDEPLIGL